MRLAHRLPTHSRYKALLIQDDEWAQTIAAFLDEDDDENASSSVTAEEWTKEQDTLAVIADLLQGIRSVLIAAHSRSGKGPKVHPLPRPRTALEKAKRYAARQRHEERVRMLLGPRAD